MRQTTGNLSLNKSANELDEALVKPFQERHNRVKRDKVCLLALWTLSSVFTFIIGYYVKTKFNEDDCSSVTDGSL